MTEKIPYGQLNLQDSINCRQLWRIRLYGKYALQYEFGNVLNIFGTRQR